MNSADDKLMKVFSFFFTENRFLHCMRTVHLGDSFHKCQTLFFGEKKVIKHISKCYLLIFCSLNGQLACKCQTLFSGEKQIIKHFSKCCLLRFCSLNGQLACKCQTLFSGKNKKHISKCCQLIFLFFKWATCICNYYFCKHLMKYCRGKSYYYTSLFKRTRLYS